MVVTNIAVMRFDEDTAEMYLNEYYPWVSPEIVLSHMDFDIDVSRATETAPASEHELKVLRGKCDPQRLILG